ncbi:(3,5-dihydroxyphenyl)acetyl-CoA 1,2-dioxygenase DpgC [Micromonospora sp. RTGN7]|uniref:(3,5-dihydroxyphenyl)acetyl-CoA 1,2-dioxygenase DpgC n=1 Tax=Micromonospora sp. RTGN7 TaxID=3016526 RepID=UPI0029FF2BC9|nr:(3,5-dihydroxyphenyl)acetyl-CoA 1,2-dioxygenase DpgC [Micromonospora sp. RTGN7]
MIANRAPAWDVAAPSFTGVLDDDARALAEFAAAGEDVLTGLPAKAERDPAQRRVADDVLTACRTARRAFLSRHVEALYDLLTDRRTSYLRLPVLVAAAAERFPGLVPSAAQMAAELDRVQADKEGREIDQGIFCAAVLRSATAGSHLIEAMLRPTPRALQLLEGFRRTGVVELDAALIERQGDAAEITFRNAHCLNAEDAGLIADLETAVDLALLDDQVRVGVLRGGEVDHPRYRGKRVFSAGINLKDLRNGAIPFLEFLMGRELGYINKMYRGLLVDPAAGAWSDRTVVKPWIGAVDSFAIGGGMQLLLVLDRVIAEADAYLSLPAAEEGIVPGLGNLRLTRLTGARLARQVVLGGQKIHAATAQGRLLCDEVVAPQDMRAAIDRAVRELSAPAVAANRRMLTLAEEPLEVFREYLAEFAHVQVLRAYSGDVLAKVERRWQRSGSVR